MVVFCNNKKCKHLDTAYVWQTKCGRPEMIVLSRGSSDHKHLAEYFLECVSFEEKEEENV